MGGGVPLSPKNLDEQAERDEEEIAEVEMILETYFMSVDNTFNKLQTLCEYIDDTEVRHLCASGCSEVALHCQSKRLSRGLGSARSTDLCWCMHCTSLQMPCPQVTAAEGNASMRPLCGIAQWQGLLLLHCRTTSTLSWTITGTS